MRYQCLINIIINADKYGETKPFDASKMSIMGWGVNRLEHDTHQSSPVINKRKNKHENTPLRILKNKITNIANIFRFIE